ncbi:AraC family transcriptional regulator [Salinihabitans flavidus]|nr:AraC family transcriptional regulator [Salinihabitans flavidus]
MEGTAQAVPLARHRRFHTADLDEAREIVSRHFCAHRLDRRSVDGRFDACQNRARGRHVSLNYLRYGADVAIEPGELESFFLIQIPLFGTAAIQNGCRTVRSDPRTASLLNPDRRTKMRWHAGCEQLLVQIDRAYMHETVQHLTGCDITGGLRFDPRLDLTRAGLRGWYRGVRALVRAAESAEAFTGTDSLHQRLIEETLVADLIEAQPSTISPLLDRLSPAAPPAALRRALTVIHDRMEGPLSLPAIAAAAGVTPRSLQMAFRRELDVTPMQYLRDLRLRFARHLLLEGASDMTVGEACYRSGHAHFGRFSTAYREKFGESPHQTLRCEVA